jgi:spore germination cell wall hydrolase CwlJ-like protein
MDDDRIALACNIYWEARTETYEGRLAVVAVTMNRVASPNYPDTVREVVWQRKQFSWTHDGLYDTPRHRRSWQEALKMASRFTVTKQKRQAICPTANQIMAEILGRPDPGCAPYKTLVNIHVVIAQQEDPTGGALFYHAHYVEPRWADEKNLTKVIGAHLFYARALVRN